MLVAPVALVDFVFSLFETTSEIIFCTARFHCYLFRYADRLVNVSYIYNTYDYYITCGYLDFGVSDQNFVDYLTICKNIRSIRLLE